MTYQDLLLLTDYPMAEIQNLLGLKKPSDVFNDVNPEYTWGCEATTEDVNAIEFQYSLTARDLFIGMLYGSIVNGDKFRRLHVNSNTFNYLSVDDDVLTVFDDDGIYKSYPVTRNDGSLWLRQRTYEWTDNEILLAETARKYIQHMTDEMDTAIEEADESCFTITWRGVPITLDMRPCVFDGIRDTLKAFVEEVLA